MLLQLYLFIYLFLFIYLCHSQQVSYEFTFTVTLYSEYLLMRVAIRLGMNREPIPEPVVSGFEHETASLASKKHISRNNVAYHV